MNKLSPHLRKIATSSVAALAGLASSAYAVNDLPGGPAVRQLNMHEPVTKLAQDTANLHVFMMVICLVIFVAVFGVMFYSILKHRKSLGHKPAHFHESVKVEIAWTLAPFIIVIFMAIPATKTVIAQKDTSNADLTIKATGHQWRWGYDYIKGEGEGISFISSLDNEHRIMSNNGAKHHDQTVHGGQLVEQLRVDNLQARLKQLSADQQCQHAAQHQHGESEQEVQGTNVFVVGGIHPTAPSVRMVVVGIVRM